MLADLEKEDIQQAVEYAAWLTQEEIHFRQKSVSAICCRQGPQSTFPLPTVVALAAAVVPKESRISVNFPAKFFQQISLDNGLRFVLSLAPRSAPATAASLF